MISNFIVTCIANKRHVKEYTSRKEPPHILAIRDGWSIRGRQWICQECYRKEHGLTDGHEDNQREISANQGPCERDSGSVHEQLQSSGPRDKVDDQGDS